MDTEMKTQLVSSSLEMIPPPAYKGKDTTRHYLIGLSVSAITILAVIFVGAFYLLHTSSTLSKERVIGYDLGDGVKHIEKISTEGDILTIQSAGDGFIAVFDQGRHIVVLKNTTSDVCYFTRLENLPEINMDDIDDMRPVYFQEVNQASKVPTDPNDVVLIFDQSARIPSDYMDVTNSDIVTNQCINGSSYWLNTKDNKMTKRSWSPGINRIYIPIGPPPFVPPKPFDPYPFDPIPW